MSRKQIHVHGCGDCYEQDGGKDEGVWRIRGQEGQYEGGHEGIRGCIGRGGHEGHEVGHDLGQKDGYELGHWAGNEVGQGVGLEVGHGGHEMDNEAMKHSNHLR